MSDVSDDRLAERLRHEAGRYEYATDYNCGPTILLRTADALDEAAAEVERLQVERDIAVAAVDDWKTAHARVAAELWRLREEGK